MEGGGGRHTAQKHPRKPPKARPLGARAPSIPQAGDPPGSGPAHVGAPRRPAAREPLVRGAAPQIDRMEEAGCVQGGSG